MERKVKFGVFSDAHVDIMHDVEQRLEVFLETCRKEEVDFIVQLGDFCYPDKNVGFDCASENAPANTKNGLERPSPVNKLKIISLFKNFEKPSYHVIGNHDCDLCSKRQVLDFYGVDYGSYYSFDHGGFHFVVLDNNNYVLDGKEYSYERGNYFDAGKTQDKPFPYVDQTQLQWLKEDLQKTDKPTVFFSHYELDRLNYLDLSEEVKQNMQELKAICDNAPNGVYLSMYGHTHKDYIYRIGTLQHYTVNSLSNCWTGTAMPCLNRYTPEIDELFPSIKYVAPYRDSVFAIVTMDDNGAFVKGVQSEFVGKSPEEMGIYTSPKSAWTKALNPRLITPSIMDRYITFVKK